ncbi:hypothetical protein [Streptomyces diastatochromogenes]|uniref:Lipoprotein n=1 Tax=Streptomyces diastatochromogenes TaxID=42236 RepID=A0A233SIJ9_STRDA|nr:hypothetical protein [Streptomyces diastatochromogenes]MCZ0988500.1 hypothetical protein [Streptomyces diastatochromogenes]OXY95473.1 hypothetical protein BEK98_15045 [Streptomyces diastatochromogenes]
MPRRTLTGLAVACAALLVPLAGCSSDHPEAAKPAETTGQERSARLPVPAPDPTGPPELDADETLAGRQKATTGNASIAFREGKKGDALIVAVRCQGAGKIKVAVRPVRMSFPLECRADKADTIYNQVAVGGADRSGVVSVEAPSSVRWSMTIGRGAPVQEEPPIEAAGNPKGRL